MKSDKYLELLKQVPFFKGIEQEEMNSLLKITIFKTFPKNYFIVRHNNIGDSMFLILSGEVKISLFSESGREVILDILREGEFFGEMSLIDEMPRSANVITLGKVEALMIKRLDFENHLLSYPKISLNIMKELVRRLRRADDVINSLSVHDVSGRIARFIIKMASDRHIVPKNKREISFDYTHKDIAAHIGTTRESVTRSLNKLIEQNIIQLNHKKLVILDQERLVELYQKN